MDSRACRALGRTALVLVIALAIAAPAGADPNVIPVAGGGASLGDGDQATAATLASPQSVAVLHDYDFYYREYLIADYEHCRVRQVAYNFASTDSDIGQIGTAVGTGTCGDSGAAANAAAATYKVDHPSSVSATPEHQLLIADSGNGRVDRWSPVALNGQTVDTVTTLAGTRVDSGQHCAIPADGSDAISAKFCSLWRVAAHPWNFDVDKSFLIIDGGCAANAGLCDATAIAPRVYKVQLVAGTWKISTAAIGCGGAGAQPVCFSNPSGVAWTGSDTDEFLVTDAAKNQVQRYLISTPAAAGVVAGTGHITDDAHPAGDDGLATAATFTEPSDIVMTGDGGYYVADTYNCLIRKVNEISPTALIFSIGGSCGDGLPDHTTVSSFDADLWPGGLALGPAGLYVADVVTNQVKLFDRTTITAKPPAFSNSGRATFQVEALEGYGPFACEWDADGEHVCQTSAGGALAADNTLFQIPRDAQPALADGQHAFHACISATATCDYFGTDPNQPMDPTPARFTWMVDTAAPQGLALTAPADGATGLPPSPALQWHTADGGPSGIDHYELFVDGKKDHDLTCTTDTCQATPVAGLSEASHTWKVRALDGAGNAAQTAERTFASGSAPTAAFTIAPNPVLPGRNVTYDGSSSSDANGPIAHYEWDLDGDGTFETDTGATAQASKSYPATGTVPISLRVTDGVGLTNVTTNNLSVTATTIAGQLGMTIDNGAQYTNSPNVTLGIVGPPTITQLLVANDGGFLAARQFAPAKQIEWKLDSSGPERLPKTVYVRFVSGPTTSPNYTDDIILDERPPVVQTASVAAAAASLASVSRLRSWKVKVKASDSNSGVAGIQVAVKKKKPSKLVAYKTKLKVKLASRPKFIRARDRAGNYSPWKKLR
jgi:hypothetical protein